MKKKQIILGTAAAVCAAALTVTVCCSRYRRPSVHRFRVGIAVYQADDPYLQSLTDQIMQALQSKNQNETEILYDFFDASGSAYQQNNQLHTMMQQEYDVILWNPVTPTNVMGILEEAESRSIRLFSSTGNRRKRILKHKHTSGTWERMRRKPEPFKAIC